MQGSFNEIVEHVPYLPEELMVAVANVDDPSALVHVIAGSLRLEMTEKQGLLEEVNVTQRLRKLATYLAREAEVISLGSKIQSQVQSEFDKTQREFFLRQQLKAIQDELGEGEPEEAERNELREQIEQANLPEDARKAADRELARLDHRVEIDAGVHAQLLADGDQDGVHAGGVGAGELGDVADAHHLLGLGVPPPHLGIALEKSDRLGHGAKAVRIVAGIAVARQAGLPVGRQQRERIPALGLPRVRHLAALEDHVVDRALGEAAAHGEAGVPGADDERLGAAHAA